MLKQLFIVVTLIWVFTGSTFAQRGSGPEYAYERYSHDVKQQKHITKRHGKTTHGKTNCAKRYNHKVHRPNCQKPICFHGRGKYADYGKYSTHTAPKPFYYPHFYEDQELTHIWTCGKKSRRNKVSKGTYERKDSTYKKATIVNELVKEYDTKKKAYIFKPSSRNSTPRMKKKENLIAHIDLSEQKMKVFKGGKHLYTWSVSTGKRGFTTPKGKFSPQALVKNHISKRYKNMRMPHAVFFNGDGYAIHGTNAVGKLGRRVSHGCIRLEQNNAATFFSMIKQNGQQNTTIQIVS